MSTDSINSWVDLDEVKKIANSLLGEEPEAKDWEAVEGGKVPESAERSLSEASAVVRRSSFSQSGGATDAEQTSKRGVLGAMDDALRGPSDATGVCVVDRDGDVLHDSMVNPAWTRYTVLAASMAESADGESVFQKVSGSNYLQLISANTSRGGILIGLLVPKPISSELVAELAVKAGEIADR